MAGRNKRPWVSQYCFTAAAIRVRLSMVRCRRATRVSGLSGVGDGGSGASGTAFELSEAGADCASGLALATGGSDSCPSSTRLG